MLSRSHLPFIAVLSALALFSSTSASAATESGVVLQGKDGPLAGKHIVLIAGDDEYRSEELIPQLARILAARHGCQCTVLFAVDPRTGFIDPSAQNIPGLEALEKADLMVIFTRFRELPDEQMKHIIDYVESGRPIIGLRTATHAFRYSHVAKGYSPYAKYSFDSRTWPGGFGRQVLGETWIDHYGLHNRESTRATAAPGRESDPILRGVGEIWGPSDVYAITKLTGDSRPLLLGQPLKGMKPTDPPNTKKRPLPVAWTKTYTGTQGKTARVVTTTMGHCGDLQSENFRRLLVNACYWCLGLEDKIPAKADVEFVGKYEPSRIHNGGAKKNIRPADYQLK
jgi:hypothetical protein